jgi:hypothetical protein
MNRSFRLPSRHSNPRNLANMVPGRVTWFATLTVALTMVGLVTGCSKASSSTHAAAEKPANSASSASAPAPVSPTASAASAPAAPASPATTSPTPADTDTAGNGTQLGAYTISLTNGYSAPLGPTAPTQAQIASNGSCDVQYNGEIYSCNSEKIVSLPDGSTPSYSACTTGTIFVDDVDPTKGDVFCILQTDGEVSGIAVTAAGSSPNNYVTLKITVWQYVS